MRDTKKSMWRVNSAAAVCRVPGVRELSGNIQDAKCKMQRMVGTCEQTGACV